MVWLHGDKPSSLLPSSLHVQAKKHGLKVKKLSGTQFRKMLRAGEPVPDWFAFRSVVNVLGDWVRSQQQ